MKISKSDISLELNCWVDELSPAQLAAYEKVASEHNAIKNALKSALNTNEGKELFNGEVFSAYSFKGKVLQEIKEATVPKKIPKPAAEPVAQKGRKRTANLDYLESSDDEDDAPLAKRTTASVQRGRPVRNESPKTPAPPAVTTRNKTSAYGKASPSLNSSLDKSTGKESPHSNKKNTTTKTSTGKATGGTDKTDKAIAQNFRPSEVTSVGGLVIGGDGKDNAKASGESKETKLQGKTFPSLVVLAKPSLKVKDMSSTRSKLDSKVKLVLMLTPNKFTEWLIQEGLLKSEQRCANHRNTELKLGVYSDATKFPYTGGYVWISECCPMRFVSVFHGSLFEGAPHPPSCILKLIYHWSCQTNIQNVVQWVKVDNVYIKGVYTWLRAACTLAIHQKCKILGGPDKFVEVGVISLGTTSQDGQQRQVKVEVLGVLDYTEKTIRLRAVEPVSDADRNYKKRFQTILEPLSRWVDKNSIISIDLTVDKMTLYQMGFKNIIQAAANDNSAKHTNSAVMDYLRRIVPRMFQNTLSLLSRQMIQQFLDELVWREQFGTYALQAFNNITAHLAEQTRMNTSETLTQRLYQVATNPFKDWSIVSSKDILPAATTPKRLKKPINEADYNPQPQETTPKVKSVKKEPKEPTTSTPVVTLGKRNRTSAASADFDYKPEKKSYNTKHSTSAAANSSSSNLKKSSTELKSIKKDIIEDDQQNGLEEMYYGVRNGIITNFETFPYTGGVEPSDNIAYNVDCPICDIGETFDSNDKLQTHLLSHIVIDGKDHQFQCLFCLEKHASEKVLSKHNQLMHPTETKSANSTTYHCLICSLRFGNLNHLANHLQKLHNLLELPYHCQACGYSSSSHRDVVRHFYDDHKNHNFLQCPFCLEIFRFSFKGRVEVKFIENYYMHLRNHINKKDIPSLRCMKCALSFCDKALLKQHLVHHHVSNSKTSYGIRQMVTNATFIPAPKIRSHHREPIPYTMQTKFGDFFAFVEDGYICAECNVEIINENHYIGLMKCNKCLYKTCCERAMFAHSISCQENSKIDQQQSSFDNEVHCICGYSTSNGNAMADHLSICGHKSAYPSIASVQENTVKKNMLDMLGLVRREGETGGEEAAATDTATVAAAATDIAAVMGTSFEQQEQDEIEQQQAIEDSIIFEDPQDDDDQQQSSVGIDMPLIGEISEPNPSTTPPPSFIGEVNTPMFNADYAQHHNQ